MRNNKKQKPPYFFKLYHLYESDYGLYSEEDFQKIVGLERKRATKAAVSPMLLLLDLTSAVSSGERDQVLKDVVPVLFSMTSEIDVKGWYHHPTVLGVLIMGSAAANHSLSAPEALIARLSANLMKSINKWHEEPIQCSARPCLP